MAKYLISTILECDILSLVPNTQERTYIKPEVSDISLFRMDYSATIVTKEEGEQKVLIEVQKALHFGDILRFRGYLGSEYIHSKLPIITIYILGFNLNIDSPAFIARPDCFDLRTKEKIAVTDDFVNKLTHKAYFIQTQRIAKSYNTRLEKLLAVFEQVNFIDSGKIRKTFNLDNIEPELTEMVNMLKFLAADESTKKELNDEEWYLKEMDMRFGVYDRRLLEAKREVEERIKETEEHKREAEERKKEAEEHKKEITEKDHMLNENAKAFKRLGMKSDEISKMTGLTIEQIDSL